jgi:hypothetical protein
MLHEIGREVDRADVVVVDEGGALKGVMELVEELAQLGGICHAVGHNAVLDLYSLRWSRRRRATAWGPRRRGWRPGTRHNQMWIGACRGSQPSQRRCKR